ncbi:MAG: sulfotransferase family protein [Bacteroidota bacterium]
MTRKLCLWSGPRNISTALMYSFAQRPDTQVVDEPLYAHYLQVSGEPHPGREEILRSQDNEGAKVVAQMLGKWSKPVVFFKQMAHHLMQLDRAFLEEVDNLLLIRQPAEVIVSFSKVIPEPKLYDIGIKTQYELYQDLVALGQRPLVLDGPELRKNPSKVLRELCERLEIPFYAEMLQWEAGARPEDGIWAPYWYDAVHRSTHFQPYEAKEVEVPPASQNVLTESQPYYDALFEHAIKA